MGLCGVVLWSPSVATSRALVLGLLALLWPPGRGEACSCLPTHPQQHFCRSAVVIRAKVTSEKIVTANEDPSNPNKLLRYELKRMKMIKGVEKVKEVRYVYTSVNTSLCGTRIAVNSKRQYFITGNVLDGGKIFINMCNYIQPWENVSMAQRESLNHHYLFNCDCEVTICYSPTCNKSMRNQCLWTDWLLERKLYGNQAHHFFCKKNEDGSCKWQLVQHHPNREEFVDVIEP
ncbi:metalloproteinase inhibitor 4 [Ictidomys tridecemlineatus]